MVCVVASLDSGLTNRHHCQTVCIQREAQGPAMNLQRIIIQVLRLVSPIVLLSLCVNAVPISNQSNSFLSLDGTWKLRVVDNKGFAEFAGFTAPGYDDSDWPEVPVPGNWEMYGFEEPEFGSRSNLMGLYRRKFFLPAEWKNSVVYIRFEGVSFGSTVWINGREVGSNWSGFTPFEVQVAQILEYGAENTLAVRVVKAPEICSLDCFDTWSLSGIYRPVILIRKPQSFIQDLFVRADYNPKDQSGRLRVQMALDSFPPSHTRTETVTGEIRLTGPQGTELLRKQKTVQVSGQEIPSPHLEWDESIPNVPPWSAESPVLATLTVSLQFDKRLGEQVVRQVGFRSVHIQGGVFMLNGVPIKLKGVCRDELDPSAGAAFNETLWRRDLQLMKAANINAVRTLFHPPDERFIDLCDEMGMYVIEEVPFDFAEHLLWDTRYLPYFLLRGRGVVTRDRSHPSVLSWSIGNENPYTGMTREIISLVKAIDPIRPVLCPQRDEENLPSEVDILAPHFPAGEDLVKLCQPPEGSTPRPVIMTAFSHALGNGCGGLQNIWEKVRECEKCAGGMIWLWSDRGIRRKVDGREVWDAKADPLIQSGTPSDIQADYWVDENTVVDAQGIKGTDGIVSSDRIPQPEYYETMAVYRPALIQETTIPAQSGKKKIALNVENRYDFTDLNRILVTWFLFDGRKQLRSGVIPVECPPHHTRSLSVPAQIPKDLAHPEDTFLLVTFTDWNGIEVSRCRVDMGIKEPSQTAPAYRKESVEISAGPITCVTAGPLGLTMNGDTGELISVSSHGKEVLYGPLLPNVYRPRSFSEQVWDKEGALFGGVRLANLELQKDRSQVRRSGKTLIARHSYRSTVDSNAGFNLDLSYSFPDQAAVEITYRLEAVGLDCELPEYGLRFEIPKSLSRFCWQGYGPNCWYPDRHIAALKGYFSFWTGEPFCAGNKGNVQWASWNDEDGYGVGIVPAKPAHVRSEPNGERIQVRWNRLISGLGTKNHRPPVEDRISLSQTRRIDGKITIRAIGPYDVPEPFQAYLGPILDPRI